VTELPDDLYPCADLRSRDLSGMDLSGMDLEFADLEDANLSRANLQNAILYGANLTGANLDFADLRGANLRDTLLLRASLRNARVDEATDFHRAIIFDRRIIPFDYEILPDSDGFASRGGPAAQLRPTARFVLNLRLLRFKIRFWLRRLRK